MKLKKNLWYGWPDYSGGDPLTSPRFKGESNNRLSFILDNHPTTNPPAPIYIHKSLSTLGAVDIDVKGLVSEKDCIYFYDTRDNMIYGLTKAGILSEKALFKAAAEIISLKFVSSSIFALDSSQGILYGISSNKSGKFISLNRPVMYYLIVVMLISIVIIVWKFNFIKQKE